LQLFHCKQDYSKSCGPIGGVWPGTNQFEDFGNDPDPELDPGLIFPLFKLILLASKNNIQ